MLVLPLTGRDEKILDVRFWHKADIGGSGLLLCNLAHKGGQHLAVVAGGRPIRLSSFREGRGGRPKEPVRDLAPLHYK